jgi:hypothetical protein
MSNASLKIATNVSLDLSDASLNKVIGELSMFISYFEFLLT